MKGKKYTEKGKSDMMVLSLLLCCIETAVTHTLWSALGEVIPGRERDRRLLYSARPITFQSDLRTRGLGKARLAPVPQASEGCVADCLMSAEFPFFVQSGRMDLQPNT